MRLGRGPAIAFLLGAAVAIVMIYPTGLPAPLTTLLMCLCPGYWVGIPLLGLIGPMRLDLGAILWVLLASSALMNGLLYALCWYLGRIARTGKRAAQRVLMVGGGVWVALCAWHTIEIWKPEPPPAPVDLASPLTGRWEGVAHGERGDRAVILICYPRTDGTLDGLYYANGELIGPIEEGTHAGDSIQFKTPAFQRHGRRDGTKMTLEARVGRWSSRTELEFVSADTARVPGIVQKY